VNYNHLQPRERVGHVSFSKYPDYRKLKMDRVDTPPNAKLNYDTNEAIKLLSHVPKLVVPDIRKHSPRKKNIFPVADPLHHSKSIE